MMLEGQAKSVASEQYYGILEFEIHSGFRSL